MNWVRGQVGTSLMQMATCPMWVEVGRGLLVPPLDGLGLSLGELWALHGRLLRLVREVEPALLERDFERQPEWRALWAALTVREEVVEQALGQARASVERSVASGQLDKARFRAVWETLGFAEHATDASTDADDYLEGLMAIERHTIGEERPREGLVNLASRAQRISSFLARVQPTERDVLFDLGSGNGKFALAVAASTSTAVVGVEVGASYVSAARATAVRLRLNNVRFVCGAVQEADLSSATMFYLYHPFSGAVASQVAAQLASLAKTKDIIVYAQGPSYGFGEYFLAHAQAGGAFEAVSNEGAVFVLRSGAARGNVHP